MAQKKTKKDLEDDAKKLAEEQKFKEEEEKRIKAEQEAKYKVVEIETGLSCVLTQYYVTESLKVPNPIQFTDEFLLRWFTEKNIQGNFKPIDLKILSEFITNNLKFAHCDLHLNSQSTLVLLNIFFQLLRENDRKYLPFECKEADEVVYEQKRNVEVRKGRKNLQQEFEMFKDLLLAHSVDNLEKKQKKFFTSEELKSIIEYARNSYFAQFNLYDYVMRKEQRVIDTFQSVMIDAPNFEPCLDNAMFMKNEVVGEKDANVIQESAREQVHQVRVVEEEEEELDPVSMQILKDNIRLAEEQMLKQLEEREIQLEQKLEEAFASKTKKK